MMGFLVVGRQCSGATSEPIRPLRHSQCLRARWTSRPWIALPDAGAATPSRGDGLQEKFRVEEAC